MTPIQWLKHPQTGVVFPATEALLQRGDMVPCLDPAGTPIDDKAPSVADLQSQVLSLQGQLELLRGDLVAARKAQEALAVQLAAVREQNSAQEAELERYRETSAGSATPVVEPANAGAAPPVRASRAKRSAASAATAATAAAPDAPAVGAAPDAPAGTDDIGQVLADLKL